MTRVRPPAVRLILAVSLAGTLIAAATPGSALGASISVHVNCYSNPERTTVRNNTSHGITINTVGSTYNKHNFEPFHINKVLKAGRSVTFETGPAATHHVLSLNYIYNNYGGLDGVKVKTSVGKFTRGC